jgi:hypothetical protein
MHPVDKGNHSGLKGRAFRAVLQGRGFWIDPWLDPRRQFLCNLFLKRGLNTGEINSGCGYIYIRISISIEF